MIALLQMREFMHHNHLEHRCRRLLEQRRHPNLALGRQTAALNARHRGQRAQRALVNLQAVVKHHLGQGLGMAQMARLQRFGMLVERAVGADHMGLRVALSQVRPELPVRDLLPNLVEQRRRVARQKPQAVI